jgi:hypothetical protein
MKAKLMATLARQGSSLAALMGAPALSREQADATLAQVFALAPWSRDALAALDQGTRDRFAAALAQETGAAREAVLDQLSLEASRACPF